MKRLLTTLGIIFISSCGEKLTYSLNKKDVLKVNVPSNSSFVEAFGAEGSYKWAGGLQGNLNADTVFKVKVSNTEIVREFKAEPGISYISVNFENQEKEGYLVIYRLDSNQ